MAKRNAVFRGRPFNSGGGGGGDFEKKIPASACRKKKIACSTNVIESQMVGPLGNTVQKKVTNVTF